MKIFKEEQRFTQGYTLIILITSLILPLSLVLVEYSKENSTMTVTDLLVTTVAILSIIGLLFLFKLNTRIDENGIHYRFFPFHFRTKTITWKELNTAYTRKYQPILEYGGWGLRAGFFNKSKGTAFNVSGNLGIQLEFSNGKKILIGTQKKEVVDRVLKTYTSKIHADEN